MFKKLFFSLMAVLLFLANIPAASANSFPDVTSFKEEIEFLTSKGIIQGHEDGTFKPRDPVTRIQAVQMILREKGVADFSGAADPGFIDVRPGHPRYGEIAKAVELGFIDGKVNEKGEKYFDPYSHLTRAQMAKILAEAYNLEGTYPKKFIDVRDDHWAREYIYALAANGITEGYHDGSFKPAADLERQHFAAFMARHLDDTGAAVPDMAVHFIDVGQGDSIFIQTPSGKTILIDGGKRSAGEKVVSYLKQAGVDSIDVMVATHPDADHIGGLIDVLETIPVKKVLDSGKAHTTETYYEYLSLIDQKNIPFEVPETGQELAIDPELKVQVLNSGDRSSSDNNKNSIVLKVTYDEVSFLLTGDATVDIEEDMITAFDLKSTILKAGHHGANTSTSQAFVNEVQPEVSILSYGQGNSYGHPTGEVVNRLQAAGSEVYSTAESGDIVVETDGQSYAVSAEPWEGPGPIPGPVTGDVRIVSKDVSKEIVAIKNFDNVAIDMTGWQLVSVEGNQRYEFPAGYVLQPGATVYVTVGPNAADQPPTYLKWTGSYIWNNSGDAAQLFNNSGVMISELQ
ncbi:S-layer homology domain-containing protein [Bacillus thermotolerans]|uniref:Late competence protein ComEC, DNA transport n=1 Tax=Bacillus thermotolerans TaxID=1221996 RepID=A0A0F5HLM6_BACTR|nr:S-layer homology domain-containing protein [Bacillus thermotolerans]KKB34158.1 Late competence protein ComEC, DNA transport [Bacillus thermotolerans]